VVKKKGEKEMGKNSGKKKPSQEQLIGTSRGGSWLQRDEMSLKKNKIPEKGARTPRY